MKLIKESGEEITVDDELFKEFVIVSTQLISDGLVARFVESSVGCTIGVVDVAKQYCQISKFVMEEEYKESYDIIINILDSDKPYKCFIDNYKNIKIIKSEILNNWKELIDKEIETQANQEMMFS